MALLGLRPSEARALSVSDLQRRDGELWLRIEHAVQGLAQSARIGTTKNRRTRTLPVPRELEEWINAHTDPRNRLKGGPLFVNPRTGKSWSYWALQDWWHQACDTVGIQVKLYEGTKHSAATDWLKQGHSERTIQEVLGHADLRSTRRYAQSDQAAAVRMLRPKSEP